MTRNLIIYGANGYTGELVAREAVSRGIRPVLAGRNETSIKPLAEELGLDWVAFTVEEADPFLGDAAVLLNCAGPFSATAKPLIDASIKNGVHYVDITGELAVFQYCVSLSEAAAKAGTVLCPGAGFDIVPTDCLAAILKKVLPSANEINLAFAFGTRPSVGTAKTLVEAAKSGGYIRKSGSLVEVANGYDRRKIPFSDRKRWAVTIPWADVYTSGISTGAENGRVFVALPWALGTFLRISSPIKGLFGLGLTQSILMMFAKLFLSGGPDETQRKAHKSHFWGEAIAPDGKRVSATLTAPSVYVTTAKCAVKVARYCLNETNRSGYQTPSMLMGADLITTLDGATLKVDPDV